MKHNTPKTSSIEKALNVLMAFTRFGNEMGTVELSQNLDLHPATVNRILQILNRKGFLHQSDQTRKFTLGPSVFHLGRAIFQSLSGNLLKTAVPYIEDLAEEVGQTVVLEVISGKDAIVVYLEQGKRGYLIGPKIGDRVPNDAAVLLSTHRDIFAIFRLLRSKFLFNPIIDRGGKGMGVQVDRDPQRLA